MLKLEVSGTGLVIGNVSAVAVTFLWGKYTVEHAVDSKTHRH